MFARSNQLSEKQIIRPKASAQVPKVGFTAYQKVLLLMLCIVCLTLATWPVTFAAGSLPLPSAANYKGAVQDPGAIQDFQSGFAGLVVGLILNFRYILGTLAVAGLVFGGFKMITSDGNEEVWKKQQATIIWSIVGLVLIGLSGEIVRIFAVGNCVEQGYLPSANNMGCVAGGFLKDPNTLVVRSTLFNRFVQNLIIFIKYIIGGLAVFTLTINALRMVSIGGGNPDEVKKDRRSVVISLVGLLFIILADPIVNNVLFKVDTTRYPSTGGVEAGLNLSQGIKEIVGFTNLLVSILGPLAVLSIVAGGIMYMFGGVDNNMKEKGKKIIQLSVIGFLIIYGAFAIVSTFLSGRFDAGASTAVTNAPDTTSPIDLNSPQ